MSTTSVSPRHWFITGVSGGLGLEVARLALAQGDVVWGSMRRAEQLAGFEALAPGRAHGVVMDVTQPQQVQAALAQVLASGRLDVLVNNAGIGMVGSVEETTLDEARKVFETNFFGLLNVTQAVLPAMRAQSSGHIINISSGVGLMPLPGMPLYSASKHAVEGLSEALAGEVAALGIKVSLVEPGAILTNFTGDGMLEAQHKLPAYAPVSGYGRAGLAHYYQSQASKPETVAKAVLDLANDPQPPLRSIVGRDVLQPYATRVAQQQAWVASQN